MSSFNRRSSKAVDHICDREVARLERRQKIERDRKKREHRRVRVTGATAFKS